MKLSTKAALFSSIVFPGSGYFIIQKNIRGFIFFFITIAVLSVIMIEVFHKAQIIAEKIVQGLIPLDINIIREQILTMPAVFSPQLMSSLSIVIGVLWLVGIVDSYRIGRLKETSDTLPVKS